MSTLTEKECRYLIKCAVQISSSWALTQQTLIEHINGSADKLSLSSLGQQDPREMPKQLENSSWRCSWTWIQTVTKLSTPTSHAPQIPRTSALSLLLSRTPSSSWTWRSTIWSNCASSTPPFPSLVGFWSYTRGTVFLWKAICIILIYCRPGLCVSVSTEFVVNIMILFKLFRGKTGCWSTVPAHFLSFF